MLMMMMMSLSNNLNLNIQLITTNNCPYSPIGCLSCLYSNFLGFKWGCEFEPQSSYIVSKYRFLLSQQCIHNKNIYNCHSKRIVRESKNLSSLDINNSKTISISSAMRKTVTEVHTFIEIIFTCYLGFKLNKLHVP